MSAARLGSLARDAVCAAAFSCCGPVAAQPVPDDDPGQYAYVVVDNAADADATRILDSIRRGLSPEASERHVGQGHFDASARIMVKFRGDCGREASFVEEVGKAVGTVNRSAVSCSPDLPGG